MMVLDRGYKYLIAKLYHKGIVQFTKKKQILLNDLFELPKDGDTQLQILDARWYTFHFIKYGDILVKHPDCFYKCKTIINIFG